MPSETFTILDLIEYPLFRPLLLMGLALFVIFTFKRFRYIIYIFPLLTLVNDYELLETGNSSVKFIMFLVALGWIMEKAVYRGSYPKFPLHLALAFGAFITISLVSVLFSVSIFLSFVSLQSQLFKALFVVLIFKALTTEEHLASALKGIFVLAIALIVLMAIPMVYYRTLNFYAAELKFIEVFSWYKYVRISQKNALGFYLLLTFPLILTYYQHIAGRGAKTVALVLCYLVPAAIFCSLSMGAIVGLMAGMTLYLALRRRRIAATLSAVAGLLLILMVVLEIRGDLRTRYQIMSHEISEGSYLRLYIYKKAFYLIEKHPLFGVGVGNFTLIREGAEKCLDNPVHNDYLAILAERGVMGGIFFLLLLFAFLRYQGPAGRLHASPFLSGLRRNFSIAFFGIMLNSFFHDNLTRNYFWWAIGLYLAVCNVIYMKTLRQNAPIAAEPAPRYYPGESAPSEYLGA